MEATLKLWLSDSLLWKYTKLFTWKITAETTKWDQLILAEVKTPDYMISGHMPLASLLDLSALKQQPSSVHRLEHAACSSTAIHIHFIQWCFLQTIRCFKRGLLQLCARDEIVSIIVNKRGGILKKREAIKQMHTVWKDEMAFWKKVWWRQGTL